MSYIRSVIVAFLLSISNCTYSQNIATQLGPGIDTLTNSTNKKIFKLWQQYLMSNPDSIFKNELWNKHERDVYHSYDLLKSEGFLQPSLYGLQPKNIVLYIKPMGDFNIINSLYYWPTEENTIFPLAITNVVAGEKNGNFELYNYLPFYTRNWNRTTVGYLKYIYYPEFPFDIVRAEQANLFIKKMFALFDIKPHYITYYIANSCDEIHALKGFDYIMSMGKSPNVCGFYDTFNNIVYSNSRAGENYRHELIHVINSQYKKTAHPILLSGLSVYTDDDNSHLGKPLLYHIIRLNEYYHKNKDIDVMNFEIKFDQGTDPYYITGAVLIDFILENDGIEGLKLALKAGTSDEELFNFFQSKYNMKRIDLNKKVRSIMSTIVRNGKIKFKLGL